MTAYGEWELTFGIAFSDQDTIWPLNGVDAPQEYCLQYGFKLYR